MHKNNCTDLFASLDTLLEREKQALLMGVFDNLPEICREKTRLLEVLEELPPEERTSLNQLQRAANRNQELLRSALAGIRDVAERVAQLRRVRDTLDTYDANGRMSSLHVTKTDKLAKRA